MNRVYAFAGRMGSVHRSFIREILKVTDDPSVISFAGGLPNPELFPVDEIRRASSHVLDKEGREALQYSTTEGYLPLREYIARRYQQKKGLKVDADDIIITTGSQQGLDLIAKVLLDKGDKVIIESPGYLGAIQAFSFFEPDFEGVPLEGDGPDLEVLQGLLEAGPKLYYAVPNFQNPSGLTYGLEKRHKVAELLTESPTMLLEDDPYGDLRFRGEDLPLICSLLDGDAVLFGSFSKVCAPGFRVGWIVCTGELREKLIVAKQAGDLHTSTFSQRVIHRYVKDNDLDQHIEGIRERYRTQSDLMVHMIRECFPDEVSFTEPEGGMVLWVTLPEGFSSMDLFERAIRKKVAFVPGTPFYVNGSGDRHLRLNFSNSTHDRIIEGVAKLGDCMKGFLVR